jgi:hypothetical protein
MRSKVKDRGSYIHVGLGPCFSNPLSLACGKGSIMQALLSEMKKRKPSIASQMWWCFAIQLWMAILITSASVFASTVLLHAVKETNKALTERLPSIRQHLKEEQDPGKLRQEASGLLDEMVNDSKFQESIFQFAVKMSLVFGLGLGVSSLGYGIFAYRLQRETRSPNNPSS